MSAETGAASWMNSIGETIDSRLIRLFAVGLGAVALLTIATAWLSIARIEWQISSDREVHADAYRSLLLLDGIASDAVQELFAYLISGEVGELDDFRSMSSTFNQEAIRYASLADLASPESSTQFDAFGQVHASWSDSMRLADTLVLEYRTTGAVSAASFAQYEALIDALFKELDRLSEHGFAQDALARAQRDRVLDESKRLLAVVAGVSVLALIAIGTFVTRRVIDYARRIQEQGDELEILAVALDSTTAGFCYSPASGDRELVYANAALCAMTGYTRDELIGQNCRVFQGEDTDPKQVAEMREAISAGREVGATVKNYRKNGEAFWNQLLISPVRDRMGRLTHFVGAMHDVTERIDLGDQLLRSQKLEAVGQLAGGVAHDFNNYLTVINGNAELIKNGSDDGELQEHAQQILEAGERSAELTRQLLAFSRRQLLVPKILDLNRVVLDLDPLLRRTLGENIRLETVTAGGLGMVNADQARIEQVLLNLVVNARDAMPEGGEITIETANVFLDSEYVERVGRASEGRHVMIAVTDSGHGIPDDILDRIFDPFFTTKTSEASGLGLSTVIGVVEQSGGSVRVYSELGAGTTFKVYLPRVSGEEMRSLVPPPEASVGLDGRVLVVDDKPMVLEITCQMVRSLGLEAIAARDAEEALEIARAGTPFDLLLTDVMLPNMNGPDLAAAMVAESPALKVLYMSGYTENGIIHTGRLDEGIHFLQKPFSGRDLSQKVTALLASPD